jgi:hypothetical protein
MKIIIYSTIILIITNINIIAQKNKSFFSKPSAHFLQNKIKDNSLELNNPPDLIAPVNGETDTDLNLTLDWSDIINFDYYQVQISTNTLFENIIFDNNVSTGSSVKIPDLTLDGNSIYYWRVRVKLFGELSNFSNYFSFKTKISVPRSWSFKANTGKSSIIFVHKSIQLKIGNRNIAPGDVIGLFFNLDNSEYCAGYGTWIGSNLSIKVWGDDTLTLNKDGFADNEVYKYKMWDSQEDRVYSAFAGYASGPDNFQKGATSILNSLYSSEKTITIVLNSGWNMISANVKPKKMLMDSIWNTINNLLVIAKNNNGNVYIPEYNINGIGDWDYMQGYQVYLIKDTILSITGSIVKPENEIISLSKGWNLVSYLRNSALDVTDALETITIDNKLVISKNNDGNVYIPEFGINTIGNMIPGQGYLMYLTSNDALIYPKESSGKSEIINNHKNYEAQILKSDHAVRENNMTLIIEFEDANYFTEIAIYDNLNNIRGSSKIINNKAVLTIWNSVNEKSDEFYAKTLNSERELFNVQINEIVDFIRNTKLNKLEFINNGLLVGKVNSIICNNNFSLSIKPNPLINKTEIEFELPNESNTEMGLYDLSGKRVKLLINNKMNKGSHKIILNSNELLSGNYYIILESERMKISKILTIIK